MMNLFNTKKNLYNFFLYFFIIFNLSNFYSYASEKNENQTNQITKIARYSPIKSEGETFIEDYILDSGDLLRFTFEGLDIFSNDYLIDRKGYLNLPEIGFYYARNKTVLEIISDLQIKYKDFLYQPKITIDIITFRPVEIFIAGEISNPGFYNMNSNEEELVSSSDMAPSLSDTNLEDTNENRSNLEFPKLFNALKVAGGVTNRADLSKIEVIRNNPLKNGGGKKKAEINLLDLIFNGNQENNIYLYDDDVINIPKTDKLIKEQFLAINKINLNPEFINIYFSGDVNAGGMKPVKKGSSLIKAIASNGGKKNFTGKIEFIRFNNEGDIERRLIRYDSRAKLGSYSNPLLVEGDIINVKSGAFGKLADSVKEFTQPILNSVVLLNLFGDN